MSDCNSSSSSCDQTPIGSPPVANACSPCAEPPTPETLIGMVNAQAAKICELETRLNNWNLLLQKERNRLSELEKKSQVKVAPPARAVSACGGAEAEVIDALAGCLDGGARSLTLPECHVPMGTPEGVKGVSLGPTWLSPRITLRTGTFSNTSYNYPMAAYDPPACAHWAIVTLTLSATASSGGSSTSKLHNINDNAVEMEVARAQTSASDTDGMAQTMFVPIVNGEIKFRAEVGAFHTSRSLAIYLNGFL